MAAIRTMRLAAAAAALAAVALTACGRGDATAKETEAFGEIADPTWSPRQLASVKGVPAAQIRTAIEGLLRKSRPAMLDDEQWRHTRRLYERFSNSPLWLAPDGLHEVRSKALTDAILNGHQDALRMNDYPIGDLARALSALGEADRPTAEQLAAVDLLLTTTYVSLAEDLLTGQVNPKTVSQSWFIDPQDERVDSALVRALFGARLDEAIGRMRPQEPEYAALQKELLRLRELAAKGDWTKVPEGKALKPGEGDAASRLQALRTRLEAEGLLAPGTAATAVYDPTLAGAVASFQARHGIPVDSILGEETVKSLNVPVRYRLGQVAANLERHRWLPRSLGDRYVVVNVPAFRVEGWEGGKKAIEMKVIVGAEYEDRATPVFSDSMETVVFRPYWNVTPDIQAKELEPKIASDPGYMARGNYEYWSDGGARRIRQKPGPENSLGLVKFLFPNDFNIYLHDTPDDKLFEKDVRAFSHGCIRLERPAEMAQWVLRWDAERVRAAMHDGDDNQSVRVPKKLPVFITYFTAYVRDGQLHFGNDLYDRDADLVKVIADGAFPRAETVQAVEALRRIAARD